MKMNPIKSLISDLCNDPAVPPEKRELLKELEALLKVWKKPIKKWYVIYDTGDRTYQAYRYPYWVTDIKDATVYLSKESAKQEMSNYIPDGELKCIRLPTSVHPMTAVHPINVANTNP